MIRTSSDNLLIRLEKTTVKKSKILLVLLSGREARTKFYVYNLFNTDGWEGEGGSWGPKVKQIYTLAAKQES